MKIWDKVYIATRRSGGKLVLFDVKENEKEIVEAEVGILIKIETIVDRWKGVVYDFGYVDCQGIIKMAKIEYIRSVEGYQYKD